MMLYKKLGAFVLITGGARSGKSRLAEQIAMEANSPVCYIATAAVMDKEMEHRVAMHQARRSDNWSTVEEAMDLVAALDRVPDGTHTVLVDCLTLWLTNQLLAKYEEEDISEEQLSAIEAHIQNELTLFCDAVRTKPYRTIVVTNEVGCGVVPDTPLGRIFRDMAGRANQQVAAAADSVWFAVAGYPLCVKEDA